MDAKKQVGGDKTKDPYYFTFFNEKNEPKKPESGDNTPEEPNTGQHKKQ
jgi:hypothetical protein